MASTPIRPTRRWKGAGLWVQKRAIPAGRRMVRQPVVRCSCQRREEKQDKIRLFTLNSQILCKAGFPVDPQMRGIKYAGPKGKGAFVCDGRE